MVIRYPNSFTVWQLSAGERILLFFWQCPLAYAFVIAVTDIKYNQTIFISSFGYALGFKASVSNGTTMMKKNDAAQPGPCLNDTLAQHVILWRRELHQYPELSDQEYQTTRRISHWLEQLSIHPLPLWMH